MTSCEDVQVLLALRPDDRSVTEERRAQAHLAVCADCAARAEAYAEQDRVIGEAPRVTLTPAQRDQLLSTIERKRRRHKMRSRLLTVVGATAAVVTVIALIVGTKFLAPSGLQQLIPGAPLPGGRSELPAGRTARFGTVGFAVVSHELTGCVTLGSGEERCPPEGQGYVWVEFMVKNSEHYPTTDDGPQISVVHQGQTLPEMLFLPEGKTSRSACTPDGHYRAEPCHFWVGATVPADARTQDLAVRASWDDKIAIWPLGDGRDVRLLSEGQFQWPTARRDISGWTFDDPRNPDHPGIDIIAERGEPIAAVAEGVVTFADSKDDYGNLVIIEHEGGWSSRYAQLDEVLVDVGQHVIPGQYAGRAGSTGNSSGPHLHFELRHDGQPVNPLNYLPPISGESLRLFRPIVFADEIELAQRGDSGSPSTFRLETAPSDPSAPQRVVATLHWRVLQPPSTEWRVFAHLEDEAGQLRVQGDARVDWPEEPCAEDELDPRCTTTSILTMTLPTDLPEGVYTMRVGLYDVVTGKRAPVTTGVTAGETSVGVWQVELPTADPLPPASQETAPSASYPLVFAGEIRSETKTVDPLAGPPGPALMLGEKDRADPLAPSRLETPAEAHLFLRWKVISALSADWRVFAHLVREVTGELALQTDASVDWPDQPCSDEESGEACAVSTEHAFTFPSGFPSGLYRIEIGLYDEETGRRARVTSPVDAAGNTSAVLSRMRIVSEDEGFASGDVERELARMFVDDPDGECGWEVLGEGDMTSYVWAICQSPAGTAVSAPAVVHWGAGRETVMKIQMPRDGSFYGEDVRLLFPPAVQERILDHDVDMDAIWRQIERDLTTVTGTVVDNAASAEVVTLEDDDGKQWHVLWRAGDAVRRSDGSRAEFRDLGRGMTVEVVGFPRPEATTPNVLAPARVTILSEPKDLAASLKDLLLKHDELPEFARQSISRDEWNASMLPVVNQGTEDWTVDLATTDSCLGAFQVEAPLTVKQEDSSYGTVYLLNAVYQYGNPDQAMQHYQNLLTRETSVPRETLYDGKTESGMQALALAFTGLDGDALYWLFGVQEQHLHLLIVNGLDDDATRAFFQATMSQVLAR